MRLRALTGLEEKLEAEYAWRKLNIINQFRRWKKLLGVIKEEILIIIDKYGDDRKHHRLDYEDLTNEDLIPNENTIIAMTQKVI